jgi:streptogramin lyase
MTVRSVALACSTVLFAACSGGVPRNQSAFLPGGVNNGAYNNGRIGSGALIVRVRVPLDPDFISPSTKGMTVDITGPTNVKKTAGLTVGAKGCKSSLTSLQCNLIVPGLTACPSKKNCYTGDIETYDAFNAAKNKIPKHAHLLSADQSFGFTIGTGNTFVPVVLFGVPRKLAFLPAANSSLVGSQDTGYVEPKCTASAQNVTVVGVDADGNYILGVGAPAVSLTSSDPAQLAVRKSAGNTFVLSPPRSPNYAYGNFTTHLTVKAKPNAKSGGGARSTTVNVSYSGDICGIITEFTVPTAGGEPVFGIAAGPDGNLWFTEFSGDKIGRITLGGTFAEFPLASGAVPTGIVTGPDGNLWFAEVGASKIGKMTTRGTLVNEYPTPTSASGPLGIAAGPDGNLWFAEIDANNVAKITTSGTIAEYPALTGSSGPAEITAGPNGSLWFTEDDVGKIGQVTTAGAITEYAIPSGASSKPLGIATGADGALWFGECVANNIGRITTAGTVFPEYPLPESGSVPALATKGPDGAVWFTEIAGNRIGAITTAGGFREYSVPTGSSHPTAITVGPDGALWFTEETGNKIGRLR